MPTWLQSTRPGSEQLVVEIDDELAGLVVDEFDRAVGPGTGVRYAPGRPRRDGRPPS